MNATETEHASKLLAEIFPGDVEEQSKILDGMKNMSLASGGPEAVGGYKCANKGCTNAGLKQCAKCHQARYCSQECQKQDWKALHKAKCGKDRGVAFGVDPQSFLNAHTSGNGQWHAGLNRKRIIERFVMSFQLRVEDTYVFTGELMGAYNQNKKATVKEFTDYFKAAKKKGMFPNDWSQSDDEALMAYAKEQIHFAVDKDDVTEKFGYGAMEHIVLRSIADNILGPVSQW
ncbi:hypothetical protein HDU79_006881 [Rhizoclosmatium sp. JEL0117]|nr:hypothetical protein HDU79_006881 [Rhizoclosmatium sp. JEL0117]